MARIVAGVEYKAVDGVTPVINKMGSASNTVFKSMVGSARRVGDTLKTVGKASVVLNQTLELGKKAWGALDAVVGSAIRKSMEYRKENDKQSTTLRKFLGDIERLQARVGDALLPVFEGISKVLGPVVEKMSDWVKANRELISGKIIGALTSMARLIVNGIGGAVVYVSRAISGWELIIAGINIVFDKFVYNLMSGMARVAVTLSDAAYAIGDMGLAKSLSEASKGAWEIGQAFKKSGDASAAGMDKTIAKQKEFEKETRAAEAAAIGLIDKIEEAAKVAARTGKSGSDKKTKDEEEAAAARRKIQEENAAFFKMTEDNMAKIHADNLSRRIQLENDAANMRIEIEKRQAEEAQKNLEMRQQQIESMASESSQIITSVMSDVLSGQKTMEKALADMASDMLRRMAQALIEKAIIGITANAAEGASSAAAANAGIPIIGPAVAAAAGATMFALILAMKDKIQGFNAGGLVPGGFGTRDTVPAMLTPGEVVIPAPVVRQYAGMSGGGAGTSNNINISLASMAPPTNRADFRKQVRDTIVPELQRLARNGQLVLA